MSISQFSIRATALTAAICALTLGSCGMLPVEEEAPPPPVVRAYEKTSYTLASVSRGDVVESVRISLRYAPAKQQNLSFGQGGVRLDGIYVSRGDSVSEGQLLAELDRSDLLAQIESYEYSIERLRLNARALDENYAVEVNSLAVRESNGEDVSEQVATANENYKFQSELLALQVKTAQRKLSELRDKVLERQIFAPFSGTVTYVYSVKDSEYYSSEGDTFVTLSDKTTSMFTTTSPQAAMLREGEPVELLIAGEAHAATVNQAGNEGNGMATMVALDEPIPGLADNATGNLHYTLNERRDVLFVPSGAVKSANGLDFVYMLDEAGIRVMQYVESGLTADGRVEIISGLSEGDEVIVE